MTTKVIVTQKHIDCGKPCRADECPVALSLQEIFPEYNVWVWCHAIKIWPRNIKYPEDKDVLAEIPIPKWVVDIIVIYDIKETMKPFSFELDIPDLIKFNNIK